MLSTLHWFLELRFFYLPTFRKNTIAQDVFDICRRMFKWWQLSGHINLCGELYLVGDFERLTERTIGVRSVAKTHLDVYGDPGFFLSIAYKKKLAHRFREVVYIDGIYKCNKGVSNSIDIGYRTHVLIMQNTNMFICL